MPTLHEIRARFPALATEFAFMDNAGGSQVPEDVIDAVGDYYRSSYVQVGADYPASVAATRTVSEAHSFVERLMGAGSSGKAILGSSTSALLRMLADAYAEALPAGSEIVVAESGHEANVSPWMHLRKRGFEVKLWPIDPKSGICRPETLAPLLSNRTRLVAMPHVSNILGGVEDIETPTKMAHEVGARVVVDGVAYAPHLAMQVADWGVDWYAFSTYKVFAPHMAALYGTHEAQAELEGPGHFFVPREDVPYKFELGGVNHEGCAGLLGLERYLSFLAGGDPAGAWPKIEALEQPLTAELLGFLARFPDVRVVGRAEAGAGRLPTVSFVHRSRTSKSLADAAAAEGIGIRWGHFYSYRLLAAMGIVPEEGVTRVSLAHTNSGEELEKLFSVLGPLLG